MKRRYGLLLIGGGLTATITQVQAYNSLHHPQTRSSVSSPPLQRLNNNKKKKNNGAASNDPVKGTKMRSQIECVVASCFVSSLKATPSPFSTSAVWEAFQKPPTPLRKSSASQKQLIEQKRTGCNCRTASPPPIVTSTTSCAKPPTTSNNSGEMKTKHSVFASRNTSIISSQLWTGTTNPTATFTTRDAYPRRNKATNTLPQRQQPQQPCTMRRTILDSSASHCVLLQQIMQEFLSKIVLPTANQNHCATVDDGTDAADVSRYYYYNYAIFGLMLVNHGMVGIVVSDPDLSSAAHWAATNAFLYTSLARYVRKRS